MMAKIINGDVIGRTWVKKKAVSFRQQSFNLLRKAVADRLRPFRCRISARWRSMAILTYVECMAIGDEGSDDATH